MLIYDHSDPISIQKKFFNYSPYVAFEEILDYARRDYFQNHEVKTIWCCKDQVDMIEYQLTHQPNPVMLIDTVESKYPDKTL